MHKITLPFSPEDLEYLQAQEDWAGLAQAYLDQAKACLEQGDRERTMMWLYRCEAACQNQEAPLEEENLLSDCQDLIEELDESPDLLMKLECTLEEDFFSFSTPISWYRCLFLLCRMQKLLLAIGNLPGCEPLADTCWVIDFLLRLDTSAADLQRLRTYTDFLSHWKNTAAYLDLRQQIQVPPRPNMQLLDLAMENTPMELSYFFQALSSALRDAGDLSDIPLPEKLVRMDLGVKWHSSLVRCGLLSGYWLRTRPGRLEDNPQVHREVACIREDLAFLQASPSYNAILQRIQQYRQWYLWEE